MAWLLGVELAQGLVGFVQYFTDLPEILVGIHLLGAAVIAATDFARRLDELTDLLELGDLLRKPVRRRVAAGLEAEHAIYLENGRPAPGIR